MASEAKRAAKQLGLKIENYVLHWKSGHSKVATRVIFRDGRKVDFIDKLTQEQAIRSALILENKGRR